jgi:hypothetical protein
MKLKVAREKKQKEETNSQICPFKPQILESSKKFNEIVTIKKVKTPLNMEPPSSYGRLDRD